MTQTVLPPPPPTTSSRTSRIWLATLLVVLVGTIVPLAGVAIHHNMICSPLTTRLASLEQREHDATGFLEETENVLTGHVDHEWHYLDILRQEAQTKVDENGCSFESEYPSEFEENS